MSPSEAFERDDCNLAPQSQVRSHELDRLWQGTQRAAWLPMQSEPVSERTNGVSEHAGAKSKSERAGRRNAIESKSRIDSSSVADDLAARLRLLERNGGLSLPPPGAGSTLARHTALFEFGRADLVLARLVEAHTDALAIFVEAGRVAPVGQLFGVWAAKGRDSHLQASRHDGKLRLDGVKRNCNGAPFLDNALVTAHEGQHLLLLNLPLRSPGLKIGPEERTPSSVGAGMASVTFEGVVLEESHIVGGPDWYTTRPGFWHGAIGSAACWAGGAVALVDATRSSSGRDAEGNGHQIALDAAEWGLRGVLERAAREIDADPLDTTRSAQRRAKMAIHLIDTLCMDVLDGFAHCIDSNQVTDEAALRGPAELALYMRECRAIRSAREPPSVPPRTLLNDR